MTLGRNSALGSQSIALKTEVKIHPRRDAQPQELCQPQLTDQGSFWDGLFQIHQGESDKSPLEP